VRYKGKLMEISSLQEQQNLTVAVGAGVRRRAPAGRHALMGYGFRMEPGGIPELVKKFKAYPKQQTTVFKKAAKACAKIMLSATRLPTSNNGSVGQNMWIYPRITDAAREQIKNGTISMKALKSKAEMQDEQIQLLKQREKEGKSGKVKVGKYNKTEQVKISSTGRRKTKGVLEYGKTGSLVKSIVSKVGTRKPKKQFVKGKNGKGKFKSVASRQVYAHGRARSVCLAWPTTRVDRSHGQGLIHTTPAHLPS
jgi:hypothetical protein